LMISVWALAYGFELASYSLDSMLFWINLEYLGIALVPAFWIVFVIKFIGKDSWITTTNLSIIFCIPLITLLLVWTNDWHHLQYAKVSLDASGPFPLLAIQPGPWYRIHTVYFYAMLAGGSYLIASAFKKADAVYQRQYGTILLGTLIPWMANMVYLLHIRPFKHIDLTPYAFILAALVIGFGLLRLRLFDLIPVAREKVIEAMREGVLVLDCHDRIVDFNSHLKRLVAVDASPSIGQQLVYWVPEAAQLHWMVKKRESQMVEIALEKDGTTRFLEVDSTVLFEKNTHSGTLLLFRDVTVRKLAQQQAAAVTDLLTGVLDSSLSGVLVLGSVRNAEGSIVDFDCLATNRRALTIVPWTTDQLVGNRFLQVTPFSRENTLVDVFGQVVETGKPLDTERELKIGENTRWLQIAAVKLNDGLTVTYSDITQRKDAEEMLRRNEANLSALIENTTDTIWSIDRQYRYVTINTAFSHNCEVITGYPPLVGDTIDFGHYPAAQATLWKKRFERALNGETFTVETSMEEEGKKIAKEHSFNPIHGIWPRHNPAKRGGSGNSTGQGSSRKCQPVQNPVSGQYEPRNPDADQRHPGFCRSAPQAESKCRTPGVPGLYPYCG
jgi:PAS domain S-box-containing protein